MTDSISTILIVDDEAHIRDIVEYALTQEGFQTICAQNGLEALKIIQKETIDLAILDILMPELDGLSLCRRIREKGFSVPVIFLSSRAEEVDRILGLELGGDDYVSKPFSPRELAVRVKTVLRRVEEQNTTKQKQIVHGSLSMDLLRYEVRVKKTRVELTLTEFALLQAILTRKGQVLSRTQLIERVYSQLTHITERTIDTHIRRIRKKLKPFGVDPIETVHGVGYKAGEPGPP